MKWLGKIAGEKYVIDLDKGQVAVDLPTLDKIIKERLLNSRVIQKLFDEFEISSERLQELIIEVVDLESKYSETDETTMKINKSLFEGGHFFRDYFFVLPHELVHWLSRIKEKSAYFNDPEEVLGFVASVGYELERGTNFDVLWEKIYPKISWHFHNEVDAKEFFGKMIEKAKKLISEP